MIPTENEILAYVKYSESENREELLKGANLAIYKSFQLFKAHIKTLDDRYHFLEGEFNTLDTDMRTLVGIIDKYREE